MGSMGSQILNFMVKQEVYGSGRGRSMLQLHYKYAPSILIDTLNFGSTTRRCHHTLQLLPVLSSVQFTRTVPSHVEPMG